MVFYCFKNLRITTFFISLYSSNSRTQKGSLIGFPLKVCYSYSLFQRAKWKANSLRKWQHNNCHKPSEIQSWYMITLYLSSLLDRNSLLGEEYKSDVPKLKTLILCTDFLRINYLYSVFNGVGCFFGLFLIQTAHSPFLTPLYIQGHVPLRTGLLCLHFDSNEWVQMWEREELLKTENLYAPCYNYVQKHPKSVSGDHNSKSGKKSKKYKKEQDNKSVVS